jgi:hypothetical protein
MTGTPSRTARVPTARWDLKEAEGKPPTRGTRSASEASDRGQGSVGVRSPKSSGSIRCICDGDGGKVTRLTLGDLSARKREDVSDGMGSLNGHEAGNGRHSQGDPLQPSSASLAARHAERRDDGRTEVSRGRQGPLHRPEARTSEPGSIPKSRGLKEMQNGC